MSDPMNTARSAIPPAIRPLAPGDHDAWLSLWQGYQAFYRTAIPEAVSRETWRRFHDASEPMQALGAFEGDVLLGIVHFIYHRSCWTSGEYCYLQDLFTAEGARGKGIGRALIEAVYEAARAAGAARVYWLTQNDNAAARALYDSIADDPGFMQYRKLL